MDSSTLSHIGLYLLAGLLFVAGIAHFRNIRFFERMIPLWIPAHRFLVVATGALEIALAIGLLFDETRSVAAILTIAMLAAYLIIHIHMLLDKNAAMGVPKWALTVRLVAQFVLMWWAYQYV